MKNTIVSYIAIIPTEILIHILSYIDSNSFFSVMLVCRSWCKLGDILFQPKILPERYLLWYEICDPLNKITWTEISGSNVGQVETELVKLGFTPTFDRHVCYRKKDGTITVNQFLRLEHLVKKRLFCIRCHSFGHNMDLCRMVQDDFDFLQNISPNYF